MVPCTGASAAGWGASGPSGAATSRVCTGRPLFLPRSSGGVDTWSRRVRRPACSATGSCNEEAGCGPREPAGEPVLRGVDVDRRSGTRGPGYGRVTRRRDGMEEPTGQQAGAAAACENRTGAGGWKCLEDHATGAFGCGRSCIACTGKAKACQRHRNGRCVPSSSRNKIVNVSTASSSMHDSVFVSRPQSVFVCRCEVLLPN